MSDDKHDGGEVRITLRLPAALRDRLVEDAGTSGRSMNAEIVARLEESFEWHETRDAMMRRMLHSEETVDAYRSLARNLERAEQEKFDIYAHLKAIEHQLDKLSARLPTITMSDALDQMTGKPGKDAK